MKRIDLCIFCGMRLDTKSLKFRKEHFREHYKDYGNAISTNIYLYLLRISKGMFHRENIYIPKEAIIDNKYLDSDYTGMRRMKINIVDGLRLGGLN